MISTIKKTMLVDNKVDLNVLLPGWLRHLGF